MATTPEGTVKKAIAVLLAKYLVLPASKAGAFPETSQGWYFMPVPTGHGVSGVPDFIGAYRGPNRANGEAVFFGIEAKAPKKEPTQFQAMQHKALRLSGARVFVVDGDLSELEEWLNQ